MNINHTNIELSSLYQCNCFLNPIYPLYEANEIFVDRHPIMNHSFIWSFALPIFNPNLLFLFHYKHPSVSTFKKNGKIIIFCTFDFDFTSSYIHTVQEIIDIKSSQKYDMIGIPFWIKYYIHIDEYISKRLKFEYINIENIIKTTHPKYILTNSNNYLSLFAYHHNIPCYIVNGSNLTSNICYHLNHHSNEISKNLYLLNKHHHEFSISTLDITNVYNSKVFKTYTKMNTLYLNRLRKSIDNLYFHHTFYYKIKKCKTFEKESNILNNRSLMVKFAENKMQQYDQNILIFDDNNLYMKSNLILYRYMFVHPVIHYTDLINDIVYINDTIRTSGTIIYCLDNIDTCSNIDDYIAHVNTTVIKFKNKFKSDILIKYHPSTKNKSVFQHKLYKKEFIVDYHNIFFVIIDKCSIDMKCLQLSILYIRSSDVKNDIGVLYKNFIIHRLTTMNDKLKYYVREIDVTDGHIFYNILK